MSKLFLSLGGAALTLVPHAACSVTETGEEAFLALMGVPGRDCYTAAKGGLGKGGVAK